MKKIITIFVIITFICCINVKAVYATDRWSFHSKGFWLPNEDEKEDGQKQIQEKANIITTVIRNIGIAVAVLSLMIIGIKEMFASAEEKSKYKEVMPGYLLGVVMVVAVTALPSLIFNIMKQVN